MSDPKKTSIGYLNDWRDAQGKIVTLEAQLTALRDGRELEANDLNAEINTKAEWNMKYFERIAELEEIIRDRNYQITCRDAELRQSLDDHAETGAALREARKELKALRAISLDSNLSWQDKHIASFKLLNPGVS